jgi:F-type H+-transporting ATPase subunit epsilon
MIKIEVVTPEKVVHQSDGEEVIIPTVSGQIGVRQGHVPLITLLQAGQIVVKRKDGSEEVLAVNGGFVEVSENIVRILADTAEHAEDLNEADIKAAIERAQKIKESAITDHDAAGARALIEANMARLRAIQRRKSRNHHHTS